MNPKDPVTTLPFVGEKYAKLLKKLEIVTLKDLLHHYPSRYQDYSVISTVDKLQVSETVTLIGNIVNFQHRVTKKPGLTIQEATFDDGNSSLKLLWFNQPFLSHLIKSGINISVAGSIERDGSQMILKNPEYEIIKAGPTPPRRGGTFRGQLIHTGRIIPIYPETKGVSSKWLRSKTALLTGLLNWYGGRYNLLALVEEWVPQSVLKENSLVGLAEALKNIHFPQSNSALQQAKARLGFDELLGLQLEAQQRKQAWKEKGQAAKVYTQQSTVNRFLSSLPFKLTGNQEKAINEILSDLKKDVPMNRLLQGDVGSGKTAVAAAAAYAAIKAGYQAAFMAPTQVLADQHAQTLTELLEPLGVKTSLLTGAIKKLSDKLQATSYKLPDLIIGTHALIHQRAKQLLDKDRLALVIIDEQHRFGVGQRAELIERGTNPHVLSMTATPIPRTVALSLYADLDISTIQEMPTGRIPVKTWVVPERKREKAYDWIEKQIKKNKAQVFVVCPLIEQSDHESMKSIKAATTEFAVLKQRFNKSSLALLHGKLAARKKTKILTAMRDRGIDILVTTPVVEVGVDIPGATIMMVETAHRFGLAQLHQLRGRVGRADKQSYCLLFSKTQEAKRLQAMETVSNGLELAQLDLKWRGPGELFSTKQHGFPKLKIADLTNLPAVQQAYRVAIQLINRLDEFPQVREKIKTQVEKKVAPN